MMMMMDVGLNVLLLRIICVAGPFISNFQINIGPWSASQGPRKVERMKCVEFLNVLLVVVLNLVWHLDVHFC